MWLAKITRITIEMVVWCSVDVVTVRVVIPQHRRAVEVGWAAHLGRSAWRQLMATGCCFLGGRFLFLADDISSVADPLIETPQGVVAPDIHPDYPHHISILSHDIPMISPVFSGFKSYRPVSLSPFRTSSDFRMLIPDRTSPANLYEAEGCLFIGVRTW